MLFYSPQLYRVVNCITVGFLSARPAWPFSADLSHQEVITICRIAAHWTFFIAPFNVNITWSCSSASAWCYALCCGHTISWLDNYMVHLFFVIQSLCYYLKSLWYITAITAMSLCHIFWTLMIPQTSMVRNPWENYLCSLDEKDGVILFPVNHSEKAHAYGWVNFVCTLNALTSIISC